MGNWTTTAEYLALFRVWAPSPLTRAIQCPACGEVWVMHRTKFEGRNGCLARLIEPHARSCGLVPRPPADSATSP